MDHKTKTSDIYVKFEDLTKKFGNFTAVSHINLEIHQGEVLGFLGPNGAGKSTTMKMMANLLKPTSGSIWIRGNGKLEKMTPANKDYLLNNIGFLIENPAFYGNMTPREILSYFAELKGYPHKKVNSRVEEIVQMVGMSDWIDHKTKEFSKGMRQKIGIISAIVHDPDIVVLDEPHTGLDPKARADVRKFILKLKDLGKTVFLSSHLLYEVSEVADRVAMISHGKIVAFDTLENLERLAKGSIIRLELHNFNENDIATEIEKMEKELAPLTGLSLNKGFISFNSEAGEFEILFNGNPDNQIAIARYLFQQDYQILGFSVPKADLLEDLYLKFIEQPSQLESELTLNSIGSISV